MVKWELRRQGKSQKEGYNSLLFLALGSMSFHNPSIPTLFQALVKLLPLPCWAQGLCQCWATARQKSGSPAKKSQNYLCSSQEEEVKSRSEVSHGETEGHRLKLVVMSLEAIAMLNVRLTGRWKDHSGCSVPMGSIQSYSTKLNWIHLDMCRFLSLGPKQYTITMIYIALTSYKYS